MNVQNFLRVYIYQAPIVVNNGNISTYYVATYYIDHFTAKLEIFFLTNATEKNWWLYIKSTNISVTNLVTWGFFLDGRLVCNQQRRVRSDALFGVWRQYEQHLLFRHTVHKAAPLRAQFRFELIPRCTREIERHEGVANASRGASNFENIEQQMRCFIHT